jgi:hypothetical protein
MRSDLLARDPQNRLIARQSRVRLEAEAVRDVSLAASGLLAERIGGPSVRPPQPEGIYVLTQQNKGWKADEGPDRYRRGLYTFFWRSSPYPFLVTFDAPDANTACTRRNRSNTPLQALTLANDKAFSEFAAALSSRVLREGPAADAERIDYAFRVCLSRNPGDAERRRLAEYLHQQRAAWVAGAGPKGSPGPTLTGASSTTSSAVPLQPAGHPGDPESAAWTALARVILNLDEFITRE